MADAFFDVLAESEPGGDSFEGDYVATPHTRGPWDHRHQHAGPPSALLARAIERLGQAPRPGLLARSTLEILRPIPVGRLRVRARVVRAGGRVALCEADLLADDPARPGGPWSRVARMTGWRIRTAPEPIPLPRTPVPPAPAGTGEPLPRPQGWLGGYLDAVEWGWVDGAFEQPGPATVWTRLLVPLLAGELPSPVQRVLAVADSGSGISAVASPRDTIFVNTELTVHLHRAPRGDRVWMRAQTVLDPGGVGLATSVLGDEDGAVGAGAQSLFVAPRA